MSTPIKSLTLEQQWLEGRRKGIGSSESPTVYIGKVYKSKPIDVYFAKINPPGPRQDNPHFRRGHTYEPFALDLFERQTGIKIYAPETDLDRYVNFQRWDPQRPWIFSDFDGICEDGWIAEVKSPMQRVADRIASDGVEDYHLVQCHHHNHIANVALDLPGVGDRWHGKIKGSRLIIYEVEQVALQVYEIPYDQAFIDDLLRVLQCFWETHVVPKVPPHDWGRVPKKVSPKGGKYERVAGAAWEKAAAILMNTKYLSEIAERRYDLAKSAIIDVMRKAKKDRVLLPSGIKLLRSMQTRKTLDRGWFAADYPGIDLDHYMVEGDPFETFRSYGKTEIISKDDTMEGGISTLHESLRAFGKRKIDVDVALSEFDRLRSQAELYASLLQNELTELESAMQTAQDACIAKVKGS